MLRRKQQIAEMIRTLDDGGWLPPITIIQNEKDEFQLEDGHHRLAAYWLAGRDRLEEGEYLLVQKDQWKPSHGKVDIFIQELKTLASPSLRERLSSRIER